MGCLCSKDEPPRNVAGGPGSLPPPAPPSPVRRGSFLAKETSQQSVQFYTPFPEELIGMHSNHGIKPKGYGAGAVAKINQDRGIVTFPLADSQEQMLIGVYDGHGPQGEKVSDWACQELIELLENESNKQLITPGAPTDNPCATLGRCLFEVDETLKAKPTVPSNESGSTAIVALLRADRIFCGCVGDSRCVKGVRASNGKWKAVDLSVDQKPDDPKEQERILAAGGYVSPASAHTGPARVWQGTYGIGPGLAMGRSIGDHSVANYGVIAVPEMTDTPCTDEDTVLILASDGVWEFMESQEAVDICFKHSSNATRACKALIDESALRWRREEGNYRDDITAVVLFLPALARLRGSIAAPGAGAAPTGRRPTATKFGPEVFDCGGSCDNLEAAASPSASIIVSPREQDAPAPADDDAPVSGESPNPRGRPPHGFMKRRLSNVEPEQLQKADSDDFSKRRLSNVEPDNDDEAPLGTAEV